MASVNKVILIGNLGKDPELRATNSGTAVANFSIATNDRWKDRDGKSQERVEWHKVIVWGDLASNCAKYLKKGSSVYAEGRLQTREYADKTTGEVKRATEIVAEHVTFLDRPPGERKGGGTHSDEHFAPPVSPDTAPAKDDDVLF